MNPYPIELPSFFFIILTDLISPKLKFSKCSLKSTSDV